MIVKAVVSTFVFLGCLSMHTAADVNISLVGIRTVSVTVDISDRFRLKGKQEISERLRSILEVRLLQEGFILFDAAEADAIVTLSVATVSISTFEVIRGKAHQGVGWACYVQLAVSQNCRLIRNDTLGIFSAQTWQKSLLTASKATKGNGLPPALERVAREHLEQLLRQWKESKAKGKAKTD